MTGEADNLRRKLRDAGLTRKWIDAAWPEWWDESAGESASARAELRFALARRLGLSPKALIGERVEFVWRDHTKFKHLSAETEEQQAIIAAFGSSIGRLLIQACPAEPRSASVGAGELREAILTGRKFVDLQALIGTCWALGIPVIEPRLFPMSSKLMHAMAIGAEGRHAILLAFNTGYPARLAFMLAHEIGHVALGHMGETGAIVDLDEAGRPGELDEQEIAANHFALELLTGSSEPNFTTNLPRFNSATLGHAVLAAAEQYRIEPGTMALCLGYQHNKWPVATSALKYVYPQTRELWRDINRTAEDQLSWDLIGEDSAIFLRRVLWGE